MDSERTKRDPRGNLLLWWPVVSRYGGLAGLIWSVVIDHLANPTALVIFGGMMGLDQVVSAQRTKNKENGA